jgi:hypothetical protein
VQCKNCVHMYINAKIIPAEIIERMKGGRDKGEQWRW